MLSVISYKVTFNSLEQKPKYLKPGALFAASIGRKALLCVLASVEILKSVLIYMNQALICTLETLPCLYFSELSHPRELSIRIDRHEINFSNSFRNE